LSDVAPDSAIDPDPIVSAGSAGCLAFHALLGRLNRAVFSDEIAAAGLSRHARIDALVLLLTRPGDLANGTAYWDNVSTPMVVETSSTVVINAINDAGAYLVGEMGPTLDTWRWGRKHTLTLTNSFVDTIDIGPYARGGGYSTIDVGSPDGIYSDDYEYS